MADYVLLYGGGKMPETEEEQAKVMQAWTAWFGQLGGDLKDEGNPFTPAAKSIDNSGAITDGPGSGMATARRGGREGQGLSGARGRRAHHGLRDHRGDVGPG